MSEILEMIEEYQKIKIEAEGLEEELESAENEEESYDWRRKPINQSN